MSSEQFQSAHENIYNIGTSLLQYLQEVQAEHESEGDGTKGLKSLENEITKSLKALKEQKYQVAVIAAMKAGKSTFLNVLIGEDILATESEACTVCRTDIRPIHNCFVPRLLEYREGQKEPIVIVQGKAEEIRNKFLERTHTIRATKNFDRTIRFELEHPIEAISKLPSLSGFTLVDTPGPNEWESADFSTVELKKTALEALRTCDAILFILDYSSFKDNTNSELLQELLEQRKEALQDNTGKLYFILNKIDRKAEKDCPIDAVLEDLKQTLIGFGIPNPIVYPASAWQGLLSKLIQRKVANQEHKVDFKKFFLAQYIEEDEDGELYVPKIADAAIQALIDSNIPKIEESVIQTVVQNSGWNLLSNALNKLDKAAKAIEDILNTRISGWEIQLEALKQKVEEYKKRSELARKKVESVKESVEEQKKILIEGFSQGIWRFADSAKDKIEEEILKVSEAYCPSKVINTKSTAIAKDNNIPFREVNVRLKIPDWIPFIGGISFTFETKTPLVESLKKSIPIAFYENKSDEYKSSDPHKIRVKTQEEGEE
ncbi:MAG: dynamin family protein [Scytonema sp. PMC 1069.18]|nr:dynamin family protein [Scytonema sp. PMC 1069.18]MEC4881778.1 dynamin family protein [Scytonema sp. PMC 1070.18]